MKSFWCVAGHLFWQMDAMLCAKRVMALNNVYLKYSECTEDSRSGTKKSEAMERAKQSMKK